MPTASDPKRRARVVGKRLTEVLCDLGKIIISSEGVTNPTVRYPDLVGGLSDRMACFKNFIKSRQIKNVVFLTNDLHFGAIDDGAASGFPEMTVGAANILVAPGSSCRSLRCRKVGRGDLLQ